jgi:hypothetical protein
MSLKVFHENFGVGQLINGMHSQPDAEGYIEYYDVMFEHGIEQNVSAEELSEISKDTMRKVGRVAAGTLAGAAALGHLGPGGMAVGGAIGAAAGLKRHKDKKHEDEAKDRYDPNRNTMVIGRKTNEEKELVGKQKKLDANHNGHLDSQDFKILRAKKKRLGEGTDEPLGDHANLTKYANEHGGVDKEDLLTAAKHMKSGDIEALKKHIQGMDTAPRDRALHYLARAHYATLGYRRMKEEVEQVDEVLDMPTSTPHFVVTRHNKGFAVVKTPAHPDYKRPRPLGSHDPSSEYDNVVSLHRTAAAYPGEFNNKDDAARDAANLAAKQHQVQLNTTLNSKKNEETELDEARGRPKKTEGAAAQRSPMEGLMAAADAMEAGAPVTFRDGNTHTVKKEHAKAALLHMARKNQTHDMPDPGAADRQAACLHSHESMLKAIGVKEEVGLSYEEAAQLIEHFEKAYASGLITEEELQEIKKSTLRKIGRVAAFGAGGALLGAGIATMPVLGLPAAAAALKASGLGTGMMVGLAHHNDHKAAEEKKDAAKKAKKEAEEAKKKEEKEKKSMQPSPVTEMTYEEALEILEQAYELGLISENELNEYYINTDERPMRDRKRPMIGDPPKRPNPLHMTPEEIKKHRDAIKKIGIGRHVIGDPPKPSPNHLIPDMPHRRTNVRYNESSNKFRSNPMAEIVNEGKMKDAIKKAGSVIKQVGKEMLGDVKSAPSTVTRSTHKSRGQGFSEAVDMQGWNKVSSHKDHTGDVFHLHNKPDTDEHVLIHAGTGEIHHGFQGKTKDVQHFLKNYNFSDLPRPTKEEAEIFGETVTDKDRVKAQAKNNMPNDIPHNPEHAPKVPPASKKTLGSVKEKGVNESTQTNSNRNKAVEEAVRAIMMQNRDVRAEAKHVDNVRRGLVKEEPAEVNELFGMKRHKAEEERYKESKQKHEENSEKATAQLHHILSQSHSGPVLVHFHGWGRHAKDLVDKTGAAHGYHVHHVDVTPDGSQHLTPHQYLSGLFGHPGIPTTVVVHKGKFTHIVHGHGMHHTAAEREVIHNQSDLANSPERLHQAVQKIVNKKPGEE